MKRTFARLWHEFKWPFAFTAIWVSYKAWDGRAAGIDAALLIGAFGAAFFFFSWLWGQYNRVNRQQKVEDNLSSVESRLEKVAADLNAAADRIVSSTVGGNSFCYLLVASLPKPQQNLFVVHVGEYPLYGVTARVVNIGIFTAKMASGSNLMHDSQFETILNIGDMVPGFGRTLPIRLDLDTYPEGANIFFTARNGAWTQLLRATQVGNDWVTATKVVRGTSEPIEVLLEQTPDEFPPERRADLFQ